MYANIVLTLILIVLVFGFGRMFGWLELLAKNQVSIGNRLDEIKKNTRS